jgi:propionate catabolism operon transcriptional regulator
VIDVVPEMKALAQPQSLKGLGLQHEIEKVRTVFASFGGDRDKTCEALGISRTTLWRKLNQG